MNTTSLEAQSNYLGAKGYLTLIAALLSMIAPFSIDTYLPSFPAIEADFGASRALLSQSIGSYLLGFALSTLIWGPLADRFGRRIVIFASLSLYVLASIGCALTEDIQSFLLIRTFQGVAASGSLIASRAMIRDVHNSKSAHRAMSHITLLFAIAPAIAPIIGGWLQESFGWRSVFWFLTSFGVVLITMVCFMHETLTDENRKSLHPSAVFNVYLRTLRNKQFIKLALTLSFSFAGMFLYIAGAPTVVYDFLGFHSNDFGVVFVPLVAGLMLGAYLSSRLAHRWPTHHTINLGFVVMLCATLLNITHMSFFASNVYTVIIPLIIYAFGIAVVMPALSVLALDCFPQHRGTATSTQSFLQMSTNAAVASFAVPFLDAQWAHFIWGQAAFLFIALVLWSSARHTTEH